MKKISLLLVLLLCVSLLFGCGIREKIGQKIGEEIGEQILGDSVNFDNGEVNVDTGDGTVTFGEDGMTATDEDGETTFQTGGNVSLPRDYPEDVVPIIKNSNILTSMREKYEDGYSYTIMLITEESLEDTKTFYINLMEDAEDVGEVEMNGMLGLEGIQDGYYIDITVSNAMSEEGTTVTINLEPYVE